MASQPPPPRPPRRTAALAAGQVLRALFRRPPATQPAEGPIEGVLAATSAATVEVASDAGRGAAAAEDTDLARVLLLARTADYFSLLGVPRLASGGEIRDAVTRLLSELDLRRLTPPTGAEAEELRDARQVVLDARDVLTDDDLRAAYLQGIDDVAGSTSP